MNWIYLLFTITWLLGFLNGFFFFKGKSQATAVGTLKIDSSDPDKDYYLLDIPAIALDHLKDHKYITLRVTKESFSHD